MAYNRDTIKITQAGLITISIGFVILLIVELNINYSHEGIIKAGKPDMAEEFTTADDIVEFPPITDFQEIIDRPLFEQDRQPYVYEEPKEGPKKSILKQRSIQKTPPQLALTATIITPDKQVAIIQSGTAKEPQHVAIGEIINSWILEEVQPELVVLKDGDKIMTLELEIQGSPVPTRASLKKKSILPKSRTNLKAAKKDIDTEDEQVVINDDEDDDEEIEDFPISRKK